MTDNRSYRSYSSRSSSRASPSAAAAATRAKAEAAKARLSFIDKELHLNLELQKLQLQKETAAAIAEAEVLKAAVDSEKKIRMLLFDSMDKIQICTIFLFQFKLGRKTAETACDINDAFGPGTTNERVAQRLFKKFHNGDESLEDEDGRGWPTVVDNEHLKALIEADPRKTTREVAVELEVDHSTVVRHSKQIGK